MCAATASETAIEARNLIWVATAKVTVFCADCKKEVYCQNQSGYDAYCDMGLIKPLCFPCAVKTRKIVQRFKRETRKIQRDRKDTV